VKWLKIVKHDLRREDGAQPQALEVENDTIISVSGIEPDREASPRDPWTRATAPLTARVMI
jgi:hypothetical protein